MNVCDESSSIIAFRDPWPTRNDAEQEVPRRDRQWLDYCSAREQAERAAAKRAASDAARRIHQELALAYAQAVRGERRTRA